RPLALPGRDEVQILAIQANESDVPDLVGFLVRPEGDPAPVGGPIRLSGIAVPRRDAAQSASVRSDDEDRVLALVRVEPLERELRPIGRPYRRIVLVAGLVRRGADLCDLVEIRPIGPHREDGGKATIPRTRTRGEEAGEADQRPVRRPE